MYYIQYMNPADVPENLKNRILTSTSVLFLPTVVVTAAEFALYCLLYDVTDICSKGLTKQRSFTLTDSPPIYNSVCDDITDHLNGKLP